MIQSTIERIMVSFMRCNKIIRLLPYELLTSCPVKRHLVSENASRLPQKSAIKLILASHLNPWPVHLLFDSLSYSRPRRNRMRTIIRIVPRIPLGA
jgi:hypothetical protein